MVNFRLRSVIALLIGIVALATSAVYTTYAYSTVEMRHVRLARAYEHPVRPAISPRTNASPRTLSPTIPKTVIVHNTVTPLLPLSSGNAKKETATPTPKKVTVPPPAANTEPKNQTTAPISFKTSSSALTTSQKNEFVSLHNKARADVGVSDLTWSDDLAAGAQKWANVLGAEQCAMRHSSEKLGENIFTMWSSSPAFKSTASDAVAWWVKEKQFYDYDQNTCKAGEQCGHYTQMVWKSTTEVGCAMTTCTTQNQVKDLWVCRYSPRGNMSGQRPY